MLKSVAFMGIALLGIIFMSRFALTGDEDPVSDGTLSGRVKAVFVARRTVEAQARALSGNDIVDGLYDVYVEVNGTVKEDPGPGKSGSYSRNIYKSVKLDRLKTSNSYGRADSMIDGWDRYDILYVVILHTTTDD